MLSNFFKLSNFLKIPKKFVFLLVIIISIISILEILGLSTLYAFLTNIQSSEINNHFIVESLFKTNSKQKIMTLTIFFFCFLFIIKNFIIMYLNYYTYSNLQKIKNKTYKEFFSKILNSNYVDLIKDGHVKYGQVFSRYLDQAFNGYLASFIKIISDFIMSFFIIIFIFYIDFYTSLFSMIYLITIASFLIKIQGKKLKKNSEDISVSEVNTKQSIFELIKNFKEIFAYKIQKIVLNQFKDEMSKYLESEKKYALTQANLKSFYEISIIILISSIFFYLLISNKIDQSISLLGIMGFSIAKLIPYINSITANLNTLKQVNYSVYEIEKFYQNTINIQNKINEKEKTNFKKINLSSLELVNLNYKYNSSENILDNFNLKVNISSMNCIVGRSGSGKTTLVDIILGLIKPNKGEVKFLNTNNNLFEFNNFAYISQTPCIFKGSLANNITFKKDLKDINKEKLLDILNTVKIYNKNVDDDLLNVNINLEGQNLSGGQKQKISIARALYHDCEILIVDEGTSNLDKESEIKVYKLLEKIKSNKIILFITHKMLDEKYFDKVVDLNKN